MINSFEAFVLILQMQLTAAEKAGSVAYAVETPVAAGTQLLNAQGNRAAFEAAVDHLKTRIHALDTLLIHCNNHGDYDGTPGTSFLCTYPSWGKYYNADFSAKLAELPKFRQLIVMLEQCNSGGFNGSIIAKSPAAATSVASAAIESQSSYVSADGNWDPFARDWIAAQAGHDPFGAALAFNPDTDADGRIEAEEAYEYAKPSKTRAILRISARALRPAAISRSGRTTSYGGGGAGFSARSWSRIESSCRLTSTTSDCIACSRNSPS
jgi:hypothetical protein